VRRVQGRHHGDGQGCTIAGPIHRTNQVPPCLTTVRAYGMSISAGRTIGPAGALAAGRADGRADGRAADRADGLADGRAEALPDGRADGVADGLAACVAAAGGRPLPVRHMTVTTIRLTRPVAAGTKSRLIPANETTPPSPVIGAPCAVNVPSCRALPLA